MKTRVYQFHQQQNRCEVESRRLYTSNAERNGEEPKKNPTDVEFQRHVGVIMMHTFVDATVKRSIVTIR